MVNGTAITNVHWVTQQNICPGGAEQKLPSYTVKKTNSVFIARLGLRGEAKGSLKLHRLMIKAIQLTASNESLILYCVSKDRFEHRHRMFYLCDSSLGQHTAHARQTLVSLGFLKRFLSSLFCLTHMEVYSASIW